MAPVPVSRVNGIQEIEHSTAFGTRDPHLNRRHTFLHRLTARLFGAGVVLLVIGAPPRSVERFPFV